MLLIDHQCPCGKPYGVVIGVEDLEKTRSLKAENWLRFAKSLQRRHGDKATLCSSKGCAIVRSANDKLILDLANDEEFRLFEYLRLRGGGSDPAIRQKRNKAAPGRTTTAQKRKIIEIQQGCCYFCFTDLQSHPYWSDPSLRGQLAHWDHLQSIVNGGTHWPENMAFTCARCNERKQRKNEDEFWVYLVKVLGTETVTKYRKIRDSQRKLKALIAK